MGKRKVLNESALKEIRLAEEGELYGRAVSYTHLTLPTNREV